MNVQEGKHGLAGVQDFLEQVALWSEPEKAAAEEEQEGAPDVVNVMTLHLSKGLEFAVVFIVGKHPQQPQLQCKVCNWRIADPPLRPNHSCLLFHASAALQTLLHKWYKLAM